MGKVYAGYTLISYNETTSPLGSESMVLRCVAPGNDGEAEAGRRVKFYLNGYEKQDFERFVKQNNLVEAGEDGKNQYHLPVELDFLRKMNESQKNAGRIFKSFHGIIRNADSDSLREHFQKSLLTSKLLNLQPTIRRVSETALWGDVDLREVGSGVAYHVFLIPRLRRPYPPCATT